MTGARGAEVWRRVRVVVGNPWFKTILTLAVLGFILFWLRGQMPFFAQGFEAVTRPHWGWVTVSLVFSYLSMSSYASVQQLLLRSAGVRVGYLDNVGLVFSSNAFSTCIPGGQVFGTTLTYRKTRQWGATRVVASWQLVISGVLSTVGIVMLALIGFFLVGSVSNPFLLVLSAFGLAAIFVGVQWAARHPDRIEGVLLSVLAWVNARRNKPADHGADGVRRIVEQAEAVDLTKTQLAQAFAFSLLNWVADIGCLWAAANAVGAKHSIGGLCIAYVTGKIVATAPITPGGLGTVEVALITALTAGGLGAHEAFATVFVYRIVSFVLVALAGWVIFFLFYRGVADLDPDEDQDEDQDADQDEEPAGAGWSAGDPVDLDPAADADSPKAARRAGRAERTTSSSSPSSSDTDGPSRAETRRPPAAISALWPLKGAQWRATFPHVSGPIPLLGGRGRAAKDDDPGHGTGPGRGQDPGPGRDTGPGRDIGPGPDSGPTGEHGSGAVEGVDGHEWGRR